MSWQSRQECDFIFSIEPVIDLQCCISFTCIAKWFIYIYILDSFSTKYWVYFPVLCTTSLLVIYFIFTSIYVSILNSQFLSHLLPSLVLISFFFMPVGSSSRSAFTHSFHLKTTSLLPALRWHCLPQLVFSYRLTGYLSLSCVSMTF